VPCASQPYWLQLPSGVSQQPYELQPPPSVQQPYELQPPPACQQPYELQPGADQLQLSACAGRVTDAAEISESTNAKSNMTFMTATWVAQVARS
jgi:hypothetical protein